MDQQAGSGSWQFIPEENHQKLRAPRSAGTGTNANANVNIGASGSAGLSANAPEFIPKRISNHQPPQQQQYGMHNSHHQNQQHHHRYRGGDNNGGGGGSLGGGGNSYGMGSMYQQQPQQHHQQQQHHHHNMGNSGMMNGTDMAGKSKIAGRLLNHQASQQQQQQQQQIGHHMYDNKDMRNPSHYNHHPNQHYAQHSQQQRLQHHQQQTSAPPHLSMPQNAAGGHFPFAMAGMGYSSTALNNHLHHPILGGMAAAAVAGGGAGGPGMMPHDNRNNKNSSSVRSRLQNAQNSQMHHLQQQNQLPHHLQQQSQHHQQMPSRAMACSNDYDDQEGDEQVSESEMAALNYLLDVISELYDNPGMFENIQRKLKGTFAEFHANQYVISNAVEMICEQSVKEQNFRYMGARLLQLLDSLDDGHDSVLWRLLRMKLEYQENELQGYMQNEQIKVRGTTLFLAELYMQLRKPQHDQRNNELALRILGAVKFLLNKEGPENIKCVCQCFKLCGFELERDRQADLNAILATLRQMENSTDCSTGRFIHSVLELQRKSWGRNEEVVPVAVVQPSFGEGTSNEFTDSPVFYGPDGQVMTEEENDFLETAAPIAFEEFEDDSDPDELVDDDNLDMEIKMAFKDFVASSKNTRQPPY